MLRIQSEVGVFPGHVTGVDVVIFVPGDRIAANGKGEFEHEDAEEAYNSGRCPNFFGRVQDDLRVRRVKRWLK
jgi:hypothetical protein